VNKHQAPTQISLATITSRLHKFGTSDLAISRSLMSRVPSLRPPKPELSIRRNNWPHPPPQPYRVSRFRESQNKESLPLVSEIAEMSNSDVLRKDWLPYGTCHRFRVSDFVPSRILMQDFWLSNLRNPETVNEV
jgi:hypothetical protein